MATKKMEHLMIEYDFGQVTPEVERKWHAYTGAFWQKAPRGTSETGAGSGGGTADFSIETTNPQRTRALAQQLARDLGMRINVRRMPSGDEIDLLDKRKKKKNDERRRPSQPYTPNGACRNLCLCHARGPRRRPAPSASSSASPASWA